MPLGSLVLEISANVARFSSDVGRIAQIAENNARQIERSFGVVSTSLKAIGAGAAVGLSLEAVKSKIEGVIESAAQFEAAAQRAGVFSESIASLSTVAKLSGTETDALVTGLQKLSKSMVDAGNGGDKTTAAFKAIGINVKDLKGLKADETFTLIAQRMAGFADGAGKTAVAQQLLGKAGANLLPVLRDIVDVGDLQVKFTEAQIKEAREHELVVKRLEAAQQSVWKVISFQLLPVMSEFDKALLKSATSADGLKGAVDGMARADEFRNWAQNAAISLAVVAESVLGLTKLARALGGSFEAVFADISAAASIATLGPGAIFNEQKRAELGKALDERNRTVAEANKRYVDLWNYNGTAISDALRKQFELMNLGAGGGRGKGYDVLRLDRDKPAVVVPPSGNPSVDAGRAVLEEYLKFYNDFLADEQKRMQEREQYIDFYAKNEYIGMRDAADRKESLIRDNLAVTMQVYDAEEALIKQRLGNKELDPRERAKDETALAEVLRKRMNAEAEGNKQIFDGKLRLFEVQRQFDLQTNERARQDQIANESAQFQIDLMGKSTLEVLKATEARRIQLETEEKIRRDLKADENLNVSGELARAAIQTAASTSLIEAAYNKQRDAIFGAHEALRKYIEDASNGGAQVENLITASLKGLEDVLVNFATTGKLSWQGLEQTILSGIDRIIIQEQLIKPLAQYLQGGTGGGVLGGFLQMLGIGGKSAGANIPTVPGSDLGYAGPFADGGYIPPGQWGWTGENGPERVYGGSSGVTVHPNGGRNGMSLVQHFAITGPADQRTQQQIATAAMQGAQRAFARGS